MAWRGVAWRGVARRVASVSGLAWRGVACGVAWPGVAWLRAPSITVDPSECQLPTVCAAAAEAHNETTRRGHAWLVYANNEMGMVVSSSTLSLYGKQKPCTVVYGV